MFAFVIKKHEDMHFNSTDKQNFKYCHSLCTESHLFHTYVYTGHVSETENVTEIETGTGTGTGTEIGTEDAITETGIL